MEAPTLMVLVASFSALLASLCILKLVYSLWWRPKLIERELKQQGIGGTSYNFLYGDKLAIEKLMIEAWSIPMSSNHEIIPRVDPFIHQIVQTYGKVCLSWIGTRPRLILGKAELVRLVLNNKNGHFQKSPQNSLVKLLALGLAALEGEKWAKHRRLITPAFHHEKLQGMVPQVLASCCNLIDRWKMLLAADGRSEIDINSELHRLSADVISRVAFGSSYKEGKKIFELQKEQIVLATEAYRALYLPGQRFLPTKKNRRRYEVDTEIKAMLRDLICKKQKAMQDGEAGNADLLGLLLQCKEEKGNELTIEDVIEECKMFYFAGQETTAIWLTWTLILLSMHPAWQEKARQEVLQICGKTAPDMEILNRLKIVTMVLFEVLRLYPPATYLARYTVQRTKVGDISIPAGVEVYVPTTLLHHDPEYWGDDAEEFNPERFAEGVSKASGDQLAFYPFGWGPRICIAQNLAMIEAKLALAMILQNFSFKLSPSYIHAPCAGFTLQPQHGAPIILKPI
ncbi:cytochrome P450 CYP72A219-like [Coffea eugenioides]|uniref:cytochrome P450 CYP72A219-like n=1 Tax=Coffea eugenioides TaxID=49369 RepID=UPI000F6081AA|nr:cytochrome P450 CYP72A219-like [Coffea eugenioides]